MASISREDRQRMRQRGAGTRNINNVDFGLSFDSARQTIREERHLMRQRGAGTRKINNVDFGIAFPTPNRARRSANKTPQAAQGLQRSSKKLSRSSRTPSVSRSVRGSSVSNRRASMNRKDVYEMTGNEQPEGSLSAAESRKLNNTSQALVEAASTADNNGNIRRSSGAQRRVVSNPTIAIAEELEGVQVQVGNPPSSSLVGRGNSPESISQHGNDKENIESIGAKPSKRRKRKSIGQQSTRRKKRSSASLVVKSAQDVVSEVDEGYHPFGDEKIPLGEQAELLEPRSEKSPGVTAETSPAIQKQKKRKRKSIVLVRKKRRSSGETGDQPSKSSQYLVFNDSGPGSKFDFHQVVDEVEDELSEDEVRSGTRRSTAFTRQRNFSPQSESNRSSPAQSLLSGDENGDESYVDDETPEPPTPAITKKSRKQRGDDTALTSVEIGGGQTSRRSCQKKDSLPKPKKTRSTFPILTHRLTNTGALPTIVEETDHHIESDDDLNSAGARFPDRAAPNAVDVLAQICRETIETAIGRAAANRGSGNSLAEAKRKRSALESFGKELGGRLFDMSVAVENRLTLESRVKKSKRDKAELQAQWIEVRRQREEVAVRCDAVRRKHWESESDGKERYELSEQLHNVEMVMGRDADDVEDGLEYMLRSVAGRVSCTGGGGLLGRVKDFNRQLERTAAALEGRL